LRNQGRAIGFGDVKTFDQDLLPVSSPFLFVLTAFLSRDLHFPMLAGGQIAIAFASVVITRDYTASVLRFNRRLIKTFPSVRVVQLPQVCKDFLCIKRIFTVDRVHKHVAIT